MSDIPPPPTGGGNARYAVIGLLLIAVGGGAIYMMVGKQPPPPAPVHPEPVRDAGQVLPTVPMLAPPIELPPETPDAGPPPDVPPPHIRYVTRYVGASCSGTINIAQVNTTAQANFGGMRSCYEHELRVNPQLRGPLSARLQIGTTGHVDGVEVHTAMASQPLVTCVKRQLQTIAFPPAHGGCAVAEVRFNFSPRE